ncbi:glia maturation factor beta [Paxillus ammoniavirescens]|nr:glia maturation factor beta [Paxillus ammoniavirescens]
MPHTVDIPDALKDSLNKFRFAKRSQGSAALVVKIDKNKLVMEKEKQFDDISIEDLVEEFPENSPRYVVLSYELKHRDGRTSFPLVLINWAPPSSETRSMTLHASAFHEFQEIAQLSKVIEVFDGPEGLTKDIIDAKLLSY